MVNPDNTVFLHNISDSCQKCLKFVAGMRYEQFAIDEKTVSAVVRELSVIGEAARKTTENYTPSTLGKNSWDAKQIGPRLHGSAAADCLANSSGRSPKTKKDY